MDVDTSSLSRVEFDFLAYLVKFGSMDTTIALDASRFEASVL